MLKKISVASWCVRFGATAGMLCSLLSAPASAHPAAFTIDQILQAPFPSYLTAAAQGKAVAWVSNVRGCRNVWVAEGGAQPHALTTFTGDDGFDIGELAWSADSQLIAFSRGGTLEDELPTNVTSSAAGPVSRKIWLVSASNGAAHEVGTGYSPKFSPDGKRLVFLDKQTILSSDPAGHEAPKPLVLDEGKIGAITFSPDGKRLAFVSQRARHSLVGVYDFGTQQISWMSPSLDQDSDPVFSPNGTELAFVRAHHQSGVLFATHRSGPPWSIWTADPQTGKAHALWHADPGTGSVFQPTLSDQNLFWTKQDQLVFPWEKTGWLQLYSVSVKGGAAKALTSGSFEVVHVALGADRSRLAFSSNQGDSDRMHVWMTDSVAAAPKKVGEGTTTIEDAPQLTADGALYALQSDATQPLQPVVFREGHWRALAKDTLQATFPAKNLVQPQGITFAAKDGQTAHGQLFVPKGNTTKHPAVLFFHGGPQRQMLLGFHPMDAYNWMYALNQYFVSEGYVVLSVNYRGGIGYGLDYREAKDFGPNGGSELFDLQGAISYLQSRPDVDSQRIGLWGGSYGGLMTALGLARASDALAAGVDYAGIYDWSKFLSTIGVPVSTPEEAHLAKESSPMATIDKWKSPTLIVHADGDRTVPSVESSDLLEALRAHDVDVEQLIIPNEVHDMTRYASWMTFFEATDAYFGQHLMNRPTK
jgi:dipeptidyl aminopeptidase/acylaminoacyl peptidase